MARMSFVETDDEVAEFRQPEPHRHLPPQHAALAWIVGTFARAFASDNECDLGFVCLSLPQKAKQRRMSLPLRHAMQIDTGIDGVAAARHALLEPAVKRRERERFGGWNFLPRGWLPLRGGSFAAGDDRLWRCLDRSQWLDRARKTSPQRALLIA